MHDRADGGAGITILIATVLLAALVTAGGIAYMTLTRRQTQAVEQAHRAMAEARIQAEQARSRAKASKQIAPAVDKDKITAAVEAMLRTQQAAWNAGDIDKFMQHYWQSETLTFSSAGQTTRGWRATIQRYRERYPSPDDMGQLEFDQLEVTPLGGSAAMVLGRWQLQREHAPDSGNFTLVVRKIDDRWLIIHDHTSRLIE